MSQRKPAMLERWVAYAKARAAEKRATSVATKPATPPDAPGWWQRWTRNLDALEARLNPQAARTRAAFRRKQSAKAVLERDARRNQKRGEDPEVDT